MRILVALGTRPEIVKLAPVVQALRSTPVDVDVVATGQHYDHTLAGGFFDAFGFEPDEQWDLPVDEAARVGAMLEGAFRAVAERKPDAVLVLGDTYTVPLFCLAARRHRVPVIHLEAGLRSFNPTSLEEVHRMAAAATATLHLAATELAASFLEKEGVDPATVHVVGNPIIDVLAASGVKRVNPAERSGVLVTAHRATNVDDPTRLGALVALLVELHERYGPVTFPVHPRTAKRLEDSGHIDLLLRASVNLMPPLPWQEMIGAIAGSRVVVTDSGGLQEEASYFGVPVVVLRRSTPRWEGVINGTAALVGLDATAALDAVERFTAIDEQNRVAATPCPYGDGRTAARIAALLNDLAFTSTLALEEPARVEVPTIR